MIRGIQENIGYTPSYLMVLYAITGCDTVSAIYCQGKIMAFIMAHKKHEYGVLSVLTIANSTRQEVQKVGETFILRL